MHVNLWNSPWLHFMAVFGDWVCLTRATFEIWNWNLASNRLNCQAFCKSGFSQFWFKVKYLSFISILTLLLLYGFINLPFFGRQKKVTCLYSFHTPQRRSEWKDIVCTYMYKNIFMFNIYICPKWDQWRNILTTKSNVLLIPL